VPFVPIVVLSQWSQWSHGFLPKNDTAAFTLSDWQGKINEIIDFFKTLKGN